MAVREGILDEQVVQVLGVDVDRGIGALRSHERMRILQPIRFQLVCNALVRMRGDLVDHGQRIGILLDEVKIFVLGNIPLFLPRTRHVAHRALQAGAVIRAVVQRNQRQRRQPCAAAREAERSQLAKEREAAFRAVIAVMRIIRQEFVLIILNDVTLLGQRKAHHLKRRRTENLGEARHILAQLEALGDRRHDLLVDRTVGIQCYHERQVVARAVAAVDQLFVISITADNAGIRQARGQHALRQHSGKSTEQVARAEMQPRRRFACILTHRVDVILRQAVSLP